MYISEGIKQTFEVIRASKVRSFLTMLGINFGVGSLIAITIIGLSIRQSVNLQMNQYGSTLTYIQQNYEVYEPGETQSLLDDSDLRFFTKTLPGLTALDTFLHLNSNVGFQGKDKKAQIIGVMPDHFEIMLIKLKAGRFFTSSEADLQKKVCILGAEIAKSLFDTSDPIGRNVQLFSNSFTVVGVREKMEQGLFLLHDGSNDNSVYVPLDFTAKRIWQGNIKKYWAIIFKFDNNRNMDSAINRIEYYLDNKYGKIREQPRFQIRKLETFIGTINSVLDIINTLILVLAAISLVVGGLGIMNIMLVTVTERTREIGLRMAIGASRKDILHQFIIEAVTLCLIGGGIGVFFGITIAVIVCSIIKMAFIFSLLIVIAALAISTVIGLLFGIYPAYKASSLTPIEALRSEVT